MRNANNIKSKTYTKTILRSGILTFLGLVLGALIGYAARVVLSRLLSIDDFGLFYAIQTVVMFLSLISGVGIISSIVKYISEFNITKKYDKVKSVIAHSFAIQFVTGVVFALAFFILAGPIAEHYFKNPEIATLLRLSSVLFLVYFLDNALKYVFVGFHKSEYLSYIELARQLFFLILLIVFSTYELSIGKAIAAFIIASPITFALFLPFFLRTFSFFKYKSKASWRMTKKLIRFGIPSLFNHVGDKLLGYVDILVLTYFATLTDVGIYNAVLPTGMLLIFLGRPIALIIFPITSELKAIGDKKKLRQGLERVQRYTFALACPVAAFIAFFSALLLSVIFGDVFASGATALRIICIGILFFTIARINNTVLQGLGKPQSALVVLASAAIINIVLDIILVQYLGIIGVAIGTAIASLSAFIISNHLLKRLTGFKVPIFSMLKIIVASILFVLSVYAVMSLIQINTLIALISGCIIGAIVYAGLILAFRIIDINEIKNMIKAAYKG